MASMEQLLDVIVEPRYDTVFIPTAGTAGPLTLFALPIGQGTSVFATASTKTLADTNMDLAGQLPAGYNFKVLGFALVLDFAATIADVTLGLNGAVFTFTIASKPYLRVPARLLSSGLGAYIGGAGATTVASFGLPNGQRTYTIGKKPLDLSQSQNFQATLTWPGGAGQAVTTTLAARTTAGAAGLPVTCVLDGFLYRPVQ